MLATRAASAADGVVEAEMVGEGAAEGGVVIRREDTGPRVRDRRRAGERKAAPSGRKCLFNLEAYKDTN